MIANLICMKLTVWQCLGYGAAFAVLSGVLSGALVAISAFVWALAAETKEGRTNAHL